MRLVRKFIGLLTARLPAGGGMFFAAAFALGVNEVRDLFGILQRKIAR